uniref:Peptidase S1 domain-containing protein n=1 Tax=Romanomermis culicivorax TaxID=13658 RepID=A0A915J3X6_ROMCU
MSTIYSFIKEKRAKNPIVANSCPDKSVPLYALDVQSRSILPRLLSSGVPFFKPNIGILDPNITSDAVIPFSYPWMVGINVCDKATQKCVHCDGVLIPWHADNDAKSIASDCVLTAAHCVKNASNGEWFQPFDIEVIAGNHGQNLFEAFEQHRVAATVYTHAGYGGGEDPEMYDIALIRTRELIYLNKYTIPVRLPERHFPANPRRCIVAGWTDPTIRGQMSTVLKQARMKILSNDQCASKSQDRLPLCAKGIDHGAICPAESSGPIVCPEQIGSEEAFVVYGITPLTGGDSCFSKPIAFTQLFSHMNWIKTVADDSIRKLFLNKHVVEKEEKN